MTDRITKERREALKEILEYNSHLREGSEYIHALTVADMADLLSLLDQPAPPTSEERREMAEALDAVIKFAEAEMLKPPRGRQPSLELDAETRERLESRQKDAKEKWRSAMEKIRSLLLSAPKTVTREWVESYFDGGLVDTAIAMLHDLGLHVEDKSEGEDE